MRKYILIIIPILATFLHLSGQNKNILRDLTNYKLTTLTNGITVITIQSTTDSLINYRFVADFDPKIRTHYPGAVEIFASYHDFYNNGYDQLYINRVSSKNTADSLIEYINLKLTTHNYHDSIVNQIITKKIKSTKTSYKKQHKNIARQICFGENSPYSIQPNPNDYNLINSKILEITHSQILNPQNFYIICIGNLTHDSIVKYADKNFGTWTKKNTKKTIYDFPKPTIPTINFNELEKKTLITVNSVEKITYNSNDYLASVLNTEIYEKMLKQKLKEDITTAEVKYNPNKIDGFFDVNVELKNFSIFQTSLQIINLMRDMIIYPTPLTTINQAKKNATDKFLKTTKNPFNIAQYAYIINKYQLKKDFFEKYENNINAITQKQLQNAAKNFFTPDNINIFIQANEPKIICELYNLAEFYKISFIDQQLRKYRIIPQGFDANFIINDYLNACNAFKMPKNIQIKFKTYCQADTIYTLKGIIYKKKPAYYFFKTILQTNTDSVLHELKIANENLCLDSSSLNAKYYRKGKQNQFWIKIYETYIFPEMYYEKLKYKPRFICDTNLLKNNIFKIKVTTPANVIFYDYYNFKTKKKIKTEVTIRNKNTEDTLKIIEYSNYKKNSPKSNIIMPHKVNKKINDYEILMKIDTIITDKKIPKKIFHIEDPLETQKKKEKLKEKKEKTQEKEKKKNRRKWLNEQKKKNRKIEKKKKIDINNI